MNCNCDAVLDVRGRTVVANGIPMIADCCLRPANAEDMAHMDNDKMYLYGLAGMEQLVLDLESLIRQDDD